MQEVFSIIQQYYNVNIDVIYIYIYNIIVVNNTINTFTHLCKEIYIYIVLYTAGIEAM